MKAIGVFPEQREIRIVDHPEPELTSPTGVELRMLEVGVCGTDKEIAAFTYGSPPPGWDYFVLGHESLGEVAAVGNEASGLEPGDLAVMIVRRPCPHDWCLRANRIDGADDPSDGTLGTFNRCSRPSRDSASSACSGPPTGYYENHSRHSLACGRSLR